MRHPNGIRIIRFVVLRIGVGDTLSDDSELDDGIDGDSNENLASGDVGISRLCVDDESESADGPWGER